MDLSAFAREIAGAARRETLARFARDCRVEDKGSGGQFDPVTEADRAAESVMRELIEHIFPEHGIAGEEFEERHSNDRYCWSLDPIDGTRSYICGLPTWVTLIALLADGEPVLGLIDVPCLDELYIGTSEGSVLERSGAASTLHVSGCVELGDARLSTTDPYLFDATARSAFEQLRNAARTTRFGHDGYAYARLAAGTLDLIIESGLKPHDYNALVPVVRGAGGLIGDWRGGSDLVNGNVIAAATPQLYQAAVAIMQEVD